jgi:hypothetical protein
MWSATAVLQSAYNEAVQMALQDWGMNGTRLFIVHFETNLSVTAVQEQIK